MRPGFNCPAKKAGLIPLTGGYSSRSSRLSPCGKVKLFSPAGKFSLRHDIIFSIISLMNSKHRKTIAAIFSEPVPDNLEWRRVESPPVAIGGGVIPGGLVRVGFETFEKCPLLSLRA